MLFVTYDHPGFAGKWSGLIIETYDRQRERLGPVCPEPDTVDLILLGVLLVEFFEWTCDFERAVLHADKLAEYMMDSDNVNIYYGSTCVMLRRWENELFKNHLVSDIRRHCEAYTEQGHSYPGDVGEKDTRRNSNPGDFLTPQNYPDAEAYTEAYTEAYSYESILVKEDN